MERSLIPNAETVYCIASCTKAFTTATCGILVEESKLSWPEPVSTYLPEFRTVNDPEIGRRATLLDLCSHGTGLAPLDHLACGFHDEFWIDGRDQVQTAANLPICYNFRSHWLYNNNILGVVGDIIAKVTGKSSGTVLHERIFSPLGMTRSCTKKADYHSDGNYARGYSVLDDGTLFPLELSALDDGSPQGAAGYVRSSVSDMLIWARAVMEAEGDGFTKTLSKDNPLRQMQILRCAHRPITVEGNGYENSYGLGWFRHMLPSAWLGSIGPNFALLPDPPIMNQEGPPRLTIAHWGEFNGFLTAFYTFPKTQSAVIVMANSAPGRGDPADLIAQMLCQKLFHMQPPVNFEDYATRAARTSSLLWPALVEEWVSNRIQNTPCPSLDDFIGSFTNLNYSLTIHIHKLLDEDIGHGPTPELLRFDVNSVKRQTAKLRHYHYDTWSFLPDSRDDAVRKGMEGFLSLPLLLISFVRGKDGVVCGLDWDLQAGVCEGPAPGIGRIVPPLHFVRLVD